MDYDNDALEKMLLSRALHETMRKTLGKGDLPGHPFRGNQYTSGEGGGAKDSSGRSVKGPLSLTGDIIAYENGELDDEGVRNLFQNLVDTGMINHLHGSYQRTAQALLEAGEISGKGQRLMEDAKVSLRPVHDIAREIQQVWSKQGKGVNYAAKPYLDAMHSLVNVSDPYYQDSGESVINYFLANAQSFRGPEATRLKTELKARLKARKAEKGDLPGHPFRGNQYTGGEGGGGESTGGTGSSPAAEGPRGQLRVRQVGSNQREVEHPNGTTVFYSYETPVAAHIPGKGYVRTDQFHSVTTSRHINQFLGGAKAENVSQESLRAMAGGGLRSLGQNRTEVWMPSGDRVFFSYQTPVAAVRAGTGERVSTSQHYSRTTSKHINEYHAGRGARQVPQSELDQLASKAEELGMLRKSQLPQRPANED